MQPFKNRSQFHSRPPPRVAGARHVPPGFPCWVAWRPPPSPERRRPEGRFFAVLCASSGTTAPSSAKENPPETAWRGS
eukprot:gene9215-biopygen13745